MSNSLAELDSSLDLTQCENGDKVRSVLKGSLSKVQDVIRAQKSSSSPSSGPSLDLYKSISAWIQITLNVLPHHEAPSKEQMGSGLGMLKQLSTIQENDSYDETINSIGDPILKNFSRLYAIVTESKFSKKAGGENEERNQDGEDMSSEYEGSPHL